jgi:hypothetical protein
MAKKINIYVLTMTLLVDVDVEELGGSTISELRRAIAEIKQRWSVIGWVTKILLSRAPPFFGRHVMSLVPAVVAVVSTHQPALGPRGVGNP